jgi:histidyl-tRNA synthetase
MNRIKAVRGMKDVLPSEVHLWQEVEDAARRIFHAYGFREIRTPIVERTELFARSIGESTDIVEKEMYTFQDRNGTSLTLRPEATAGILRAYIEHHIYQVEPVQKLFCIGPMFRHERPQKGRYRQFHQINAEILGSLDPRTDAELLAMLKRFFSELGLEGLDFQLNSLGCPRCRPQFKRLLQGHLEQYSEGLCEDCTRRLRTNPLRVLDCKVEGCQRIVSEAPGLVELICRECREHLQRVRDHLELIGVPHTINPRIVRGLDYYTRTTFEVIHHGLGAQSALCGGGRYDQLMAELGGPDLPGIGFAIGEERLVTVLSEQRGVVEPPPLDLFIAALGDEAQARAFVIMEEARGMGLRTDMDLRAGSLKSQMRRADKLGARRVLILGDEELRTGEATLREMTTGSQERVPLEGLREAFCSWRGKESLRKRVM